MSDHAYSLFVSDVHLCQSRPASTAQFLKFLQAAQQAQALYVLGDLFEYWAGDDDLTDPFNASITQAFHQLSQTGTALYFMHGNRDFLLGDRFTQACGATWLPDPSMMQLYGYPLLLSHGDAWCTDDIAYQHFRQQVRTPQWQARFMAQPLEARKATIAQLRQRSEQEKSQKSMMIMDVNPDAVAQAIRQAHYPTLLIHGHTHRPASHIHDVDNHRTTRFVLPDWYETGGALKLNASGVSAF